MCRRHSTRTPTQSEIGRTLHCAQASSLTSVWWTANATKLLEALLALAADLVSAAMLLIAHGLQHPQLATSQANVPEQTETETEWAGGAWG